MATRPAPRRRRGVDDLGVYSLNTTRFLLDADPEWVDGHTRGSPPIDAVDEHVDFHVGCPGAVGSFSASFSGQPNAHLVVHGTEGRVTLRDAYQPNRARTVVVERGEERTVFEGLGGDDVCEEFDHVAHAVLTGGTVEPDGRDGLTDVGLMEQVYAAAEGERGR